MRLRPLSAVLAAALVLAVSVPVPARAQAPTSDWGSLLRRVHPQAERFSDREGDPPVFRAFRTDPSTGRELLIGYAFLTSDFPPEEMGFDAPVEVLVGMSTEGVLTGVVVTSYRESLRSSRGDFLSAPGFQEQFTGKRAGDAFQVKRDVQGITGATISVGAMSRGIRGSARRVAQALGLGAATASTSARALDPVTATREELSGIPWSEMVARGLVQQLHVLDRGRRTASVSLMYLRDPAMAELVIGPTMLAEAVARAGARAQERHMIVAGVEGLMGGGVNLARLKLVQGSDTVAVAEEDVLLFGPPREGKLDGQVAMTRVLLVDRALDMSRPFRWVLDLRPALDVFAAEYPGRGSAVEAVRSLALGAEEPATPAGTATADSVSGAASPQGATAEPPGFASAPTPSASAVPPRVQAEIDFAFEEQETLLARTLAQISWPRVAALLALLTLASAAFATRRARLRWATLLATLVYLGWMDRGFLSVSHITSAVRVGADVYLGDVALLLLVAFTVVTTLLWGRVFCGYLCPFGALQDVLERLVPRRLKREPSQGAHRVASLGKYGALAVVAAPALTGSGLSLYQYFEPFGTVFFPSRSLLLWGIAISLLAASAIVPRFYCRYVCPLGAALAIGSLLSPFRIRRVEQCGVCKVCEQRCPTRAIDGARLDFKECVRCGVCEEKLIQKAGVCRHDMEEVRSRLVRLTARVGSR